VLVLTEDVVCRLGWSTEKGDLQAPVGYDGFSFAYRDKEGTIFHQSRGRTHLEPYGTVPFHRACRTVPNLPVYRLIFFLCVERAGRCHWVLHTAATNRGTRTRYIRHMSVFGHKNNAGVLIAPPPPFLCVRMAATSSRERD
jgi:hypothetical protein